MQATQENFERLKSISLDAVLYDVSENGKLHGWLVSVPTTRELADKFLNGEIGEQSLLEMTPRLSEYDTVYLCAAATLPEYRRQGVSKKLTNEAFSRLPLSADFEVYIWPTTPEGFAVTEKFKQETDRILHIKQ